MRKQARRNALSAMRIAAALLALAAIAGSARAQDLTLSNAVVVSETNLGHEARIAVPGCEAPVRLEYRPAQNAAHYRDSCKRPIADKLVTIMQLLGPALERAAAAGHAEPTQLVVFVGRIVQTFPDLAAELVTAAARTSGWDADVSRRSATAANAAVVQLLTRTDAGTAIRTATPPGGYRVTGIAVEKVLTAKPQRLPFPLPPHIVSANADRALPFDALLWIALRRELAG